MSMVEKAKNRIQNRRWAFNQNMKAVLSLLNEFKEKPDWAVIQRGKDGMHIQVMAPVPYKSGYRVCFELAVYHNRVDIFPKVGKAEPKSFLPDDITGMSYELIRALVALGEKGEIKL